MNTGDNERINERRIILVGAMGVGKSTIGKKLSQVLGWKYIDNDSEISTMTSLSIRQLSELEVPKLHALEASFLREILKRPIPFIASAPASVADDQELLNEMQKEFVIYLHMPIEKHILRAGSVGVGRQGLEVNPFEVTRQRYERRDPRYRRVAALVVEVSSDPDRDVETIIKFIDS